MVVKITPEMMVIIEKMIKAEKGGIDIDGNVVSNDISDKAALKLAYKRWINNIC